MNTQDAINRINLGKCEIIREYNNTVDDYNDVYNYCRDHSLTDEHLKKLVVIGESLYEIYEKSMKYVIFKTYYEKTQDGSMTFNNFEQQVVYPLDKGSKSSLFNTRLTIKTLCEWMAKYANPQLQVFDENGNQISSLLPTTPVMIPQAEIDTVLLQSYAGDAHNNNKHKFDYSADAQLLQVCEQIFRLFLLHQQLTNLIYLLLILFGFFQTVGRRNLNIWCVMIISGEGLLEGIFKN